MTYPPQPGQQGPHDPYGQQQPGGYQQQPGYQQFPQGGPQGGPQQAPYGAQGGYPPPPRKRGPLPWILAGGGVVVVAVVVVLIIVLSGGGSGDSPKSTADALASAINDKDVDAVNALMCEEKDKIEPGDADKDLDKLSNVRVKSVSEPKDDKASAVLTATIDGKDDDSTFPMRKKDGKWCIGEEESQGHADSGGSGPTG